MQKEIVIGSVLDHAFGDLGLTPISAGDFLELLAYHFLSPCFGLQWVKPGVFLYITAMQAGFKVSSSPVLAAFRITESVK